MDIIRLTQQLIDIRSLTGGEKNLVEFLDAYLTRCDFKVEAQVVEEGRENLLVNYSPITEVIFCTHLDTVPPHYVSTTDDSFIYGRGACDAKGSIAAMIDASIDLRMENENKFALLFVVGEETDSIGAKKAASPGLKARYVIVGEPTENKLAIGQKGSLSYTLTVNGIAGHSAYPERGRSAIHALLDILHDLRTAEWGNDTLLGEGTMNVGLLGGGVSANTIAAHAEATIFHRLVDGVEKRKEQVAHIVRDRAGVEFHAQNDPQRLHHVNGFETTVVNFGSDVPYLRAIGTPLLIGPGSIHDAHTTTEKILISQLREASLLYKKLYFVLTQSSRNV